MLTRKLFAVTLCYTALALLVTWPLVVHLRSGLPGGQGDPLLTTSILWWNAHVTPLTDRWWNGFAFGAAPGTLAFSDHRLGLSLIATPLQWLGADAGTAYNLTFLATYPLCALAGYALGFTLTRRHDAAFICGLAYGFNPFRVAHIGHLELLAGFAMPVALAALHMYRRDPGPKWIGAFAAALLVQGLCGTYYIVFFAVVLALWTVWFVRWSEWRVAAVVAGAYAATALVLLPIAVPYAAIHRHYGFSRLLGEVETFSADITSIAHGSPLLRVWSFTAVDSNVERQIFPGLSIVVLALAGLFLALRRSPPDDGRWRRVATASLLAACAAELVSLSWTLFGSWQLAIGSTTLVKVTDSYKPASWAVLALAVAAATRPALRAAWSRRSVLAFYALAAAFLFVCALGPTPRFFGEQVLTRPPYEWLMTLPFVGTTVRAPARFAMLMILALSAAAAVSLDRLRLTPRQRRAIVIVAAAGIIADGWIKTLDLPGLPPMWPIPGHSDFAEVAEVPMAPYLDAIAMYRATIHGRPLVNGNSGFFPPHYLGLLEAFAEGNPRGLGAFSRAKPLLVVVDRERDADGRWERMIAHAEHAAPVGGDRRWALYSITTPQDTACDAPSLVIASVTSHDGQRLDVSTLTDGRADTKWISLRAQQVDDALVIDVRHAFRLCAVKMSLGTAWHTWPRDLEVTTSEDGVTWTRQFKGSPSGLMVEGALANPRDIWITVPLHGAEACYVRLRLDAPQPGEPWLIEELRVTGS